MASLVPLRIGLIGAGTVGGGVYEIIMNLANKAGRRPCVITKICVRDMTKPRSFVVDPTRTELVTNVDSILLDDSIELVVEVMGGTGLAKTVVESALKKGKSVVTANKALIADHLDEIHQLTRENDGSFAFEAAVCGGIPIIQTLYGAYTGDTIHEVMVSTVLLCGRIKGCCGVFVVICQTHRALYNIRAFATAPPITCWVKWKRAPITMRF
jgi:homoserine dehydrogenase